MTERVRLILKGKEIVPATADEAAIKTAIDNAGSGGGADIPTPGTSGTSPRTRVSLYAYAIL